MHIYNQQCYLYHEHERKEYQNKKHKQKENQNTQTELRTGKLKAAHGYILEEKVERWTSKHKTHLENKVETTATVVAR